MTIIIAQDIVKYKYKYKNYNTKEIFVMKKQTFALYFGNRGFMPAELIEGAREDMVKAVTDAGYDYLIMDKDATRYGAVETRDEGRLYHDWLKSHEGSMTELSSACLSSSTRTAQ